MLKRCINVTVMKLFVGRMIANDSYKVLMDISVERENIINGSWKVGAMIPGQTSSSLPLFDRRFSSFMRTLHQGFSYQT